MAESLQFREQAERCRRLARDCTDDSVRDNLLGLADEYVARAVALEDGGDSIPGAGPEDRDA